MSNFMMIFLMPQPQEGGSAVPSFVFLLMIIMVFYFFMIRPQMKKQKDLNSYRENLNKGDKIITTGGMYGKVLDIKDQTVTMEIADNVRIKIDKNAVLKDNADLAKQK